MNRIESGSFIYSLTPPAENIAAEKLNTLNKRRIERLSKLKYNAISIYDVQEEKERTSKKRIFKYRKALNPLSYSESLSSFTDMPQIIYLASSKYTTVELHRIFKENRDKSFVLVGSPGKCVQVKTTLSEAYKISTKFNNQTGGVLIGERHQHGNSEVDRVLSKIKKGSDFFISQCIYDVSLYKTFLNDYLEESTKLDYKMKPVIFTFSPIGNLTGLDFMKWLGVKVPECFKSGISNWEDFFDYSVCYLENIAKELIDFCRKNNIPFGVNFESIIGKKPEVMASIELAERVSRYL